MVVEILLYGAGIERGAKYNEVKCNNTDYKAPRTFTQHLEVF